MLHMQHEIVPVGPGLRKMEEALPKQSRSGPQRSPRSLPELWLVLIVLTLASGCATSSSGPELALARPREDQLLAFGRAQQTLECSFPPAYRAAHRAVITIGRRQYVCDGFLSAGPTNGLHLALVSTAGLVGEVRWQANGTASVLKVTPLFRESWSRDYVLRDLRWLFGPPGKVHPAGAMNDGRLALKPPAPANRRQVRYLFSADGRRWEGLEILEKGRPVYRADVLRHRQYEGWPYDLPGEIHVDAGLYQLHLRLVQLNLGWPVDAAGNAPEMTR